MNCTDCRRDPTKRIEWGCDAPAVEPVAWLHPCPFCHGDDEACVHCNGDARGVALHRCPNQSVESRHIDVVNAAVLAQQGILQDEGAWQDQSATFTAVFPLLVGEINHWRNVAIEVAAKRKQNGRK
jgi:hypothetical protein